MNDLVVNVKRVIYTWFYGLFDKPANLYCGMPEGTILQKIIILHSAPAKKSYTPAAISTSPPRPSDTL